MKKTTLFFAAFFALCVAFTVSAQSNYAWWLKKTYNPKETTIAGFPVKAIYPTWKTAQTFTRESFTKKELADVYTAPDFKPVWEVKRDINKDGKMDRVLVGVARTNKGGLERFLLVLTQNGNTWTKAHLERYGAEPKYNDMGFSYLMDAGKNGILWADCFECDGGGYLIWKNKRYQMEYPDYGD